MKVNLLVLVFLVVASGCILGQTSAQQPQQASPQQPTPQQSAPQQPPATMQEPFAGADNAVYLAVARYQIASWQIGAHAYCFRVKGQDADKKFLNQLKPYPARPESDCTQRRVQLSMAVVDKRSKKSAVMFGLGNVYWPSPTKADVEGSYLCGTQCMAGGIYHVVQDGNAWKVTNFEVRISQ